MNVTTSIRDRALAIRLVVIAIVLMSSLPGAVLAQEAESSPEAGSSSSDIDFPIMLIGQLLTAETYSGAEWIEAVDGDEADIDAYAEATEALVAGVGKTLDDLTVKSALYEPSPDNRAVIAALRIDDVDAREWVKPAVALLMGDLVEPDLLMRPLADKWALRVVDATMPGVYPRTVYLKGDTAWIIEGDEDYVWDALEQLPEPDAARESAADSLLGDLPVSLDDRRRVGLYETTEALFLPTLGERLGSAIDPWLLDLYLETGLSPSEMVGVWAWWGLPAPEDGLQIEGYRLPPGGEEMMQRLYADIFLARPAEEGADPETTDELPLLLAGIGYSEGEVAGRQVTTLDYGVASKHIFLSADGETVWVVTDSVGEPAATEAAVSALP